MPSVHNKKILKKKSEGDSVTQVQQEKNFKSKNLNKYNESKLLLLLKQHDKNAFEYLYDHYSQSLYSIILPIVHNKELANDLLQEVFVKIWRQIESYDKTKGMLSTWMRNVAKNASIDARRSKYFQEGQQNFPQKAVLDSYNAKFKGSNEIIASAREGLTIFAINDFEFVSGKTQKEIATLIHITPKTLQSYATGSKKLPTLQSELLLKLLALYAKGLEVFADVDNFNGWLKKSAFGLYNDIPETLLTTSTGISEVMDELSRIEYGDLA